MPSLQIKREGRLVGSIKLDKEETLLGRQEDCDFVLADVKASRSHAKLIVKSGQPPMIEDLGSHNGTVVNGARIEALHNLKEGDEIQIGSHVIVYYNADEPPAESSGASTAQSAAADDTRGAVTFQGGDDGELGDMLRGMLDKAKKDLGSQQTVVPTSSSPTVPSAGVESQALSNESEKSNTEKTVGSVPQGKNMLLIILLVAIALLIIVLAIALPYIMK